MLSNSDEYDGGEVYVAEHCDSEERNFNDSGKIDIKIIWTCCLKLDASDLAIFEQIKKEDSIME